MFAALARLPASCSALLRASWRRIHPGREAGTFAGLSNEFEMLCASHVPVVARATPRLVAEAPRMRLAA